LPNAQTACEAATNRSNSTGILCQWDLQWMLSKHSDEYQLEGKSGASSCGNSSSKGVY